ncbi:MAG: DNA polymerase III, subunit gamma and tau [Parcubacteria group bacterium RIFCSPLOWO2_01_FULL_40_65]|nr:MAG: DNA polymerase III, subunit gamma and tau [Parcubacteria group bacterium RIFCSPHIGHO2_01_FULL_40_30]OHB21155.1 MAG: DNA polymerase III, subunit gamma and tau [Parcubacteria group bacterium RIFCSPLOWO2_01_FULL_40_65]OHB22926.1 MAG: DNA polymerase III, subunit gamma and tau [Parcubacteria group bacterium RIFCSPLOWO2_02_FULL_40_12]OHB24082.1 MAG: DNA polymerase III, subunit gamma and tau [Parcubacteria group bacterium RIFCSPLOWO2_12_FULL_40_10]
MDLALYRKYRPKSFKEVVGQEHIVKSLQGALELGKISHAYLFIGPRGTGKTTMARLLAKTLNCEKKDANGKEPCNICFICKEFNEGRNLDLTEIDAASNRGIDEIRNLRESVRFGPTHSYYKVYIIDEVHQLTDAAFNALLKTLEEPPSHAIFILASTEPQKIPETISSRTQQFNFRNLTQSQILEKLNRVAKAEKLNIDDDGLKVVALSGHGSLRDAESNLGKLISFGSKKITLAEVEDLLGFIPLKSFYDFTGLLILGKREEAVSFISNLYDQGLDLEEFSKSFIDYLRKLLISNLNPATLINFAGYNQEETRLVLSQAKILTKEQIVRLVKIFMRAKEEMRISPIQQLPLELAVLEYFEN